MRKRVTAETLQRAKLLQYEEIERVKLLRSQQLYTDVIETRQNQLKEKEEEVRRNKMEESLWHERTMNNIQQSTKKEENSLKLKKQKAVEIALATEKQKLEAEARTGLMKFKRMGEEKTFIRKLEEDNTKALEVLKKNKLETRNKLMKDMEKLAMDVKIKKNQERMNEMDDEERRQRDIERSSFVAKARSDLEVKHFQERQADRKLLSHRASKELEMRASREVEIFIRDQKAIEDKEYARKEEETRRQLELEKAVHESRKKQISLKQEQKKKEKELDSTYVIKANNQCLADLAREKGKKAERRKTNLEYKRLQEEQTTIFVQKQAKHRQAEMEGAMNVKRALDTEDDIFRDFAVKEVERFRSQGKKTDLLKKVLQPW